MKKKLFSAILLTSVFACLLAGCNGGIGSHDHNYGNWTFLTQPTCTETGTRERTCSICGHKETQDADTLPHAFNEANVCADCGLALKYSTGLAYELSEDGKSYVLTGIGACLDTDIVLPYYYEGKPITEIQEMSFVDSHITSFTAQNGLKTIGKSAFNNCTKLTNVYLYDSVEEIGNFAFSFCTSLTTVRLSDNLKKLDQIFYSCSALKEVEIGSKVREIAALTFFECTSLEEIYLPASVETIGARAFSGCKSLKSIGIPANVTVLESGLFVDCGSLRRVTCFGKPTKFSLDLFMGCKELKTVVYSGTKKEFNNAEKELFWNGDVNTGEFSVTCSNGTITWKEIKATLEG